MRCDVIGGAQTRFLQPSSKIFHETPEYLTQFRNQFPHIVFFDTTTKYFTIHLKFTNQHVFQNEIMQQLYNFGFQNDDSVYILVIENRSSEDILIKQKFPEDYFYKIYFMGRVFLGSDEQGELILLPEQIKLFVFNYVSFKMEYFEDDTMNVHVYIDNQRLLVFGKIMQDIQNAFNIFFRRIRYIHELTFSAEPRLNYYLYNTIQRTSYSNHINVRDITHVVKLKCELNVPLRFPANVCIDDTYYEEDFQIRLYHLPENVTRLHLKNYIYPLPELPKRLKHLRLPDNFSGEITSFPERLVYLEMYNFRYMRNLPRLPITCRVFIFFGMSDISGVLNDGLEHIFVENLNYNHRLMLPETIKTAVIRNPRYNVENISYPSSIRKLVIGNRRVV